jgi:membrane associated rhomboid family serine protease
MSNRSRSLRYTRQPYRELLPYATIGIIIICAVCFALELANQRFIDTFAFNPAAPAPWMFVSSIFLHADIMHIFWNMFMLFMFGTVLEKIIGHRDYIALFILAGIVGNVGYMLFCHVTGEFYWSLGASGAIYGVFACLAILYPSMRVYLFFFIPAPIILVLVFFAAVDIFFMGASDNVAHAAHLAGLLVGVMFALYIRSEAQRYRNAQAYVEVRYDREGRSPPSEEDGFLE